MKYFAILLVGSMLTIVSCKTNSIYPNSAQDLFTESSNEYKYNSFDFANKSRTENSGQKFGKNITAENSTTLRSVISQLTAQDSVRTKFTAKVESVCQVKGCWMNLVPSEAGNDEIFVKFKDYAFFMPLDIAGRNVIVEGVAYKEVTPVDELKHYAEDEGLPQEEIDKITEPKEEIKFMADGVIVL